MEIKEILHYHKLYFLRTTNEHHIYFSQLPMQMHQRDRVVNNIHDFMQDYSRKYSQYIYLNKIK